MYNYYNYAEMFKPEEVLVYLRKSRADDPLLSVDEVLAKHEAILNEWIARNLTGDIPEENRIKERIVSGESIADRPEFQRLLKIIESPRIKAVLVVDISRLGRPDLEEIGRITKIFRYTGTLVITPMKTFDITDEYDRDLFERELKRGNEYLEYTKKLLSRGRELSAKAGNYMGRRSLYGYDKITVMDGKKRCPTLAINEEQANIVRMIFNAFVYENVGPHVIAKRLNEMKITPPASSQWAADTIRHMLDNPHYIGMVQWNYRKAVVVVDDGEFRKTRPKTTNGECILCKGRHEAIISEEVFYAAQEKRGRTHRTISEKELRNPLSSMLFCECGRAMSYRHTTRPSGKNTKPRLVCNNQSYCGNASCSPEEIVEFVVEMLKERIAYFEEEIKKGNSQSYDHYENQIKVLEKKLADIGARELALWEAQLDTENRMPPHIFQSLTEKLQRDREDTETAIAKLREMIKTPVEYEVKLVTFQQALDALLDDTVSVVEKNRLLKLCIERITYRRGVATRKLGRGCGKGYVHQPIELDIKLNI